MIVLSLFSNWGEIFLQLGNKQSRFAWSFVLTSKLAYKCTGYACGFTSETPQGLSDKPLFPLWFIR